MVMPEQIEKKQFSVRKLRGYDPNEVDDFLDEILVSYKDALQQLGTALTAVENLRNSKTTQVIPPVIGDAVKLLNVAQQTHDQTVREANDAAGRVLSGAEKEAADIVAAGHEKRHAMIGQLEERRAALEEHVTALQKTLDAIRGKMHSALEVIGE